MPGRGFQDRLSTMDATLRLRLAGVNPQPLCVNPVLDTQQVGFAAHREARSLWAHSLPKAESMKTVNSKLVAGVGIEPTMSRL